jgi:hypothetical protein
MFFDQFTTPTSKRYLTRRCLPNISRVCPRAGRHECVRWKTNDVALFSVSLSLDLTASLVYKYTSVLFHFVDFCFRIIFHVVSPPVPNLLAKHGMRCLTFLSLQLYLYFVTNSNVHFPVISAVGGLFTWREIHFHCTFYFWRTSSATVIL